MSHLYILLLVLSLMSGILTSGLYLFLYQKYQLQILRYYLYHLLATITLVFFTALNYYLYLNLGFFTNGPQILIGYTSSILFFSSPLIYTAPVLIRELTELGNNNKSKFFFAILALVSAGSSVFIYIKGNQHIFETLLKLYIDQYVLLIIIWFNTFILFFSIIYTYYLLLTKFRKIQNKDYKIAVYYLVLYSAFSIALIYFDFQAQNRQILHQQYPVGIYLQPVTLLLYSLFSILYLYNRKIAYTHQLSVIPTGFLVKYSITEREKEITEFIIKGLSNKEIASKLFLSHSTVRNHISNIFEKTDTPSRGKLLNLIKSFQ